MLAKWDVWRSGGPLKQLIGQLSKHRPLLEGGAGEWVQDKVLMSHLWLKYESGDNNSTEMVVVRSGSPGGHRSALETKLCTF